MLSHADIWGAIDKLAVESGISVSALAKRSGLDPTTFNRSKRQTRDGKPRWPSTESVAKVLGATSRTVADFAALVGGGNGQGRLQRIPVVGYAQASRDGVFDGAGFPAGTAWDEILFPDLGEMRIYALEIAGDSMAPLYRDGDLLIVSPSAGLRRGDRVVLRTRLGEVMARELARRTAKRVDVLALNPLQPAASFAAEEISWMSRILWVSQ